MQGDNKGFLVCKKKMATSAELLCRYTPPAFRQVRPTSSANVKLWPHFLVLGSVLVQDAVPIAYGVSACRMLAAHPAMTHLQEGFWCANQALPVEHRRVGMPAGCCCDPSVTPVQFAEAVVNLKFDEEPKYQAFMALFDPLCGPQPHRPILTDGQSKVALHTQSSASCHACSPTPCGQGIACCGACK